MKEENLILTQDYINSNLNEGIITVDLSSWEEFLCLIREKRLHIGNYIWRGQRSIDWLLESKLERTLKKFEINGSLKYLERFKYGVRGEQDLEYERLDSDDDWWAAGQNHSLFSPLLEWTSSPFIAAFYAFYKDDDNRDKRVIYSFAPRIVNHINNKLRLENFGVSEDDLLVKCLNPLFDVNSRLADRSGLFTKSPIGIDIEQWVRKNFSLAGNYKAILLKLTLPNDKRIHILNALNKMNINPLTIFPEYQGGLKK
ncbi:FRG domain-containing protein [Desulfosporosinus sp. PR]|uniref:FRG domain-containing protein n=1 Tax=Candidatus Desulfosporosinus nitrosoreducens TaxID=3401928 RepID=UPI0027F38B2D|nr:FRG domain-containing protein [Desulfosporosinus sp. PR]MDQ7093766.1 FRG domain-containing protein [Desulfosporosinus sp. PR]